MEGVYRGINFLFCSRHRTKKFLQTKCDQAGTGMGIDMCMTRVTATPLLILHTVKQKNLERVQNLNQFIFAGRKSGSNNYKMLQTNNFLSSML